MTIVTEEQLKEIMPGCPDPPTWVKALNDAMERFDITTPDQAAAFLAQVAHESGEFRDLTENLDYSAKRLMKVWPKRFPTLDRARLYEHNPAKLANYVYAKRLGNGDETSGDGWLYRGRGILQITGRGNYRSAGEALDLPLETQPELLEEPENAALSAAQFWKSRGLNELADDRNDDNDDEDFVRISVIINGGREGLDRRRAYWAKARDVLLS